MARAAEGYSNLELDLATGGRGSRHEHVEALLRELTGAEAAMAVNNCAGAVLLAAAALAGPGARSWSRAGSSWRSAAGSAIPEVIAQAGARLVEVGTTNRTRLADYERAIGPATGAVLRAHPSNFRQLGFVEEVEIEELCELGVPVIDDVGSGALADELELLRRRAVGAALGRAPARRSCASRATSCSAGRRPACSSAAREAVDAAPRAIRSRARCGSTSSRSPRSRRRSRCTATRGARRREIPVLAMLDRGRGELRRARRRLAAATGGGIVARGREGRRRRAAAARAAGPGRWRVAGRRRTRSPRALRAGDPPVVGRIEDGRLLLDPRTLADDEASASAARAAVSARR